MIRTIAFASAVALLAAIAHPVLAGPIDYAFGNTIRSESTQGIVDYYINEDGTFSLSTSEAGTWAVNGSSICLTIVDTTSCGDIHEDAKPGDSWTEDDGQNGTRTVTLIEGR